MEARMYYTAFSRAAVVLTLVGTMSGAGLVGVRSSASRPHRASAMALADDTLPECPHDWSQLPKRLGGGRVPAEGFYTVGPITDVPEFHDCQRLVDSTGEYGPLVAVFAAYDL